MTSAGCFNWHESDFAGCVAERGPGKVSSLVGELVDYLGSIMLVAFFEEEGGGRMFFFK